MSVAPSESESLLYQYVRTLFLPKGASTPSDLTLPPPPFPVDASQTNDIACRAAGGTWTANGCVGGSLGMSTPSAPTTPSPLDTCEAECYSRYGVSCIPLLKGTRLECSCLRACRQSGGEKKDDVLSGAGGIIVVVVGVILVIVALTLLTR